MNNLLEDYYELRGVLPEFLTNPSIDTYLEDDFIVFDLETTNIDKGDATTEENQVIVGYYKTSKGEEGWIEGTSFEIIEQLAEALEPCPLLVGHGLKFDLKWLRRYIGNRFLHDRIVYDTLLGEYVRYGNLKVPLGLGETSNRYGYGTKDPLVDKMIRAGICPSEIPYSFIKARVKKDVEQTYNVFLKQREALYLEGKLEVLYTRCLVTCFLADIEFNGMYLDSHRVEEEYLNHKKRLLELDKELEQIARGINFNSPKQLGEFIYNELKFKPPTTPQGDVIRTSSGQLPTDVNTLLSLKTTTAKQRKFISLLKERSKVSSALSKNLDFFYGVVTEGDGTFVATFNQSVTRTHRLSSSGKKREFKAFPKKSKSVQFQNMDRTFKRLFKARKKGWKILEADGANLEFRVAGSLGRDEQILQDVIDEVDVHSFTRDVLIKAGQKTDRQGAKAHTFKPLYGGESGTKAEKAYYAAFKEKYKGIAAAQEQWKQQVLRDKKIQFPWGIEFSWPDCTLTSSGYIKYTPSICNYPVQSLATAEIILIGIVYLWHLMFFLGLESFIVNTIHDSVIIEENPKEEELLTKLIVLSFTTFVYEYMRNLYNYELFVPLGVGIKSSEFWGEGKETKITNGELMNV